MNTLKLELDDKTVELHFGSWVMGQLAKRGWGFEIKTILNALGSNPFVSMATLIHLGMCSAQKKTLSLSDLNEDDAYDVLDQLSKQGQEKVIEVRDAFLLSAFGEEVLTALKSIPDENEEVEDQPEKKQVKAKRK